LPTLENAVTKNAAVEGPSAFHPSKLIVCDAFVFSIATSLAMERLGEARRDKSQMPHP
jgi:hypothetical protein